MTSDANIVIHRFSPPLIPGRLLRRYKRFMADVELHDGSVVTAHCVNTGSMLGCCAPGSPVYLSPSDNPKRKLRFTWEVVDVGPAMVGINTGLPNRLAEAAIAAGMIPELAGYAKVRREARYGERSRVDLLLTDADREACYVEVKNVTLGGDDGVARFPDAVTARGTKHLRELAAMVEQGHRAAMLYMVQRDDCERVAAAGDVDPVYAATLRDVRAQGVEAYALRATVTPEAICVDRSLPVLIDPERQPPS